MFKLSEDGTLEIFSGVTVIRKKEFYEIPQIKKLILPDTVREIGVSAFEECENLCEIVFSENLIKIDEKAFFGTGVESLVFPDSLYEVETHAFSRCSRLREVSFGNGIRKIYDLAFSVSDVRRVIIPDVPLRLLHSVFFGCDNLEYLECSDLTFSSLKKIYNGDHIISAFIAGCEHRGRHLPDSVAELVREKGEKFLEGFMADENYSCAAYLVRYGFISKKYARELLGRGDSPMLNAEILEYLNTRTSLFDEEEL